METEAEEMTKKGGKKGGKSGEDCKTYPYYLNTLNWMFLKMLS